MVKVSSLSVVKITLCCTFGYSGGAAERAERLNGMFGDYGPFEEAATKREQLPQTLYQILRKAVGERVGDTEERTELFLCQGAVFPPVSELVRAHVINIPLA